VTSAATAVRLRNQMRFTPQGPCPTEVSDVHRASQGYTKTLLTSGLHEDHANQSTNQTHVDANFWKEVLPSSLDSVLPVGSYLAAWKKGSER